MDNSILWRRLDTPGHDACRLAGSDGGWQVEGAAAFLLDGVPACLDYQVQCDKGWRTRKGRVQGWFGSQKVDFHVERTAEGRWVQNGRVLPHLSPCLDLDFGFTPATNLTLLRRMALEVGQAVDVTVAWIDVTSGLLDALHQRYERRTAKAFWYEAPRFDYYALLEVRENGFVARYPGLWVAES